MKNFSRLNRREFLSASAISAAGVLGPARLFAQHSRHAQPVRSSRVLDASTLAKFVDPLPIPAVLKAEDTRPSPDDPAVKVPYYRVPMRAAQLKLHRDLPATRFWGFNSMFPGPLIEARSGQPLFVEWINDLPGALFLPVDHNLEGAGADKPPGRAVVHLHGSRVPPESDGYPESWFLPGKSSVCFYPNRQDAATLWYHDHTMGINRLNIYAGLFGMCLLRDEFEDGLGLPSGKFEIPLVLCDRMFDKEGQLYYPVSPDPEKPWLPEVFGDAVLVNGRITPYCEVEPRAYRFRILNASNGRFFPLTFANGMEFHQIGSDQGLLPAPVSMKMLVLGPGERADVIVDFSKAAGESTVLNTVGLNAMQFRVGKAASGAAFALPKKLRDVPRIPESDSVKTRDLLIEETDDGAGNPTVMLLNRKRWMDPVTENPTLGSIEIWSLINGTDDSHPIHLHLVRFQVLDRRSFYVMNYRRKREMVYTGPPVPPDANEMGWKDTVRAEPGMVTRIIVRFDGYPGRYVWHCHILEHEDNEMMRPLEILPAK